MVKIDFVNAQEPAINDTNLNQMQLNIENAINAQVSGDTLPVGCIVPFTSDTVPENWLLCDGQAVSRTDYALLFSIIGTTYGVGDGSTTFNLPNLKGRVAVGKDSTQTEFDTLGETGGEKTHTQTIAEMPEHFHGSGLAGAGSETGYGISYTYTTEYRVYNGDDFITRTGNGQPMNNLQPYQVTNYIIKARQSSGIVATVVDGLNSTSTTNALSANQGKVLKEMITGVEVFNGSSNGNITLSQSCQNAQFMEIYYADQENTYGGYTKIFQPNGKRVSLTMMINDNSSAIFNSYDKIKIINISGTSITNGRGTESVIQNNISPTVSDANYIYIKKVILYF